VSGGPRPAALALLVVAALAACGRPEPAAPGVPVPVVTAPTASVPSAPPAPPGEGALEPGGHVRITFLDVGQGDGALVTTDDGASLLIDLGPREAAPRIDEQLARLGGAVGAVLVTHAHADHLGQLDSLARTARIGALWDPGFAEHPVAAYDRALRVLSSRGVPHVIARRGMHLRLGRHADVEILGPREPLLHNTRSDPNANSVVVRLSHASAGGDAGTRHVLFTGDAEHPTETRLLEAPEALAADVLKVAHHGSKHASSAAFLRAVHPSVAVVSCGRANDYGHPHAATLGRLALAGTELHRTDLEGDITVDSEGGRLSTLPSRPATREALATPGRSARATALDAP